MFRSFLNRLRQPGSDQREQGFTLIELLVVMVIIAILLTIVSPRYFNSVDRAKETVLKQNLGILRDAIDKYYADTGKYPVGLQQLVEDRYIRAIPVDPVTEEDVWVEIPPPDPEMEGVFDIHTTSDRQALDGTFYEKW
ncbi:prepilin-type N-terminal cleavage/methylation domain-containing protein [Nitrosomonas sp. HPC101]|uniref:prepilin-type N-terminal cleavage/methylation domain-containing protein n=1 Tax=Nitrosomonas sp. HPC101 TaxID=1658667 RepID=UPI00136C3836|nr:prepilin-type N-terminal cleavage/methylation domain-containing protein [Nitrosomonas sp. HPC101]